MGFTAFFGAAFLATTFLATTFFATTFLATAFLATTFLATTFFPFLAAGSGASFLAAFLLNLSKMEGLAALAGAATAFTSFLEGFALAPPTFFAGIFSRRAALPLPLAAGAFSSAGFGLVRRPSRKPALSWEATGAREAGTKAEAEATEAAARRMVEALIIACRGR